MDKHKVLKTRMFELILPNKSIIYILQFFVVCLLDVFFMFSLDVFLMFLVDVFFCVFLLDVFLCFFIGCVFLDVCINSCNPSPHLQQRASPFKLKYHLINWMHYYYYYYHLMLLLICHDMIHKNVFCFKMFTEIDNFQFSFIFYSIYRKCIGLYPQ